MDHGVWRAVAVATSFGFTLALLTVGGVLGGRWIDGHLHTAPLFTIIGLLLGLGVGFVGFVRQVIHLLGDGTRR